MITLLGTNAGRRALERHRKLARVLTEDSSMRSVSLGLRLCAALPWREVSIRSRPWSRYSG
jgi:hypothetical protein